MTKTLCALYRQATGREPVAVEPLPASGSARRYYRLAGQPTLMGVHGESAEENRAFIYLSRHFRGKGLPVPQVLAVSADGLHYVQEDLGSTVLFDTMAHARETGVWGQMERDLLKQTIRLLADVQMRGDEDLDYSQCYPQAAFDRRTISWDLAYFKNCFLRATGVAMREDLLEDDFDRMTAVLLAGGEGEQKGRGLAGEVRQGSTDGAHRDNALPWGFMYRDFQSRNVMVRDHRPWLIDFQGGRRGPCLYDVASFLWQARARYPETLRRELLDTYIDALRAYHPDLQEERLRKSLPHFIGFRILQTLGAYGYRGYFERKPHFVQSVPPALANLQAVLAELGDAYPYLRQIVPMAAQAVRERENIDRAKGTQPPSFSLSQVHACGTPSTGHIPPHIRGEAVPQVPVANPAPMDSGSPPSTLTVSIHSFSYRRGLPDDPSGNGGGFIFDCRAVHNPGRYERYKQMTGLDAPVVRFLEDDGGATRFLGPVYTLVDASVERYLQRGFTHLSVGFGCTGGQHRSVYCAEQLARHIQGKYPSVRIELVHRERGLQQVIEPKATAVAQQGSPQRPDSPLG